MVKASVDIFGERALERFVADGRVEPSAKGRHCVAVTLLFVAATVVKVGVGGGGGGWWGDGAS